MQKIFHEIVSIMHKDYAGWQDKQGWDRPDFFKEKLDRCRADGTLTPARFTQLVQEYLMDFRDRHMYFTDLKAVPVDRGFRVRRYRDRLFVTEVHSENRVNTGDAIVTVGGLTVAELKNKHGSMLDEVHPERENWQPVLARYGEIQLSDGTVIKLQEYEREPYSPVYSIRKLGDTVLIKLTDFMNPDAIRELIRTNETLLDEAAHLIMDVRTNYGGSDASYLPLLPYLMPEEGVDLSDTDEVMLFNCTSANAEREAEKFRKQLAAVQDPDARLVIEAFKTEWERNRGRGFSHFNLSDLMPDLFIRGIGSAEAIVVLTDVYCGSSGDSFAEACRRSDKVTVMGRGTMGLNDYANLATAVWDRRYELMYPTSRLSRIDEGKGMSRTGVEPHVHIPWTPEHLERDVDLGHALAFLKTGKCNA
ncbi:S41 family peptidase [Alteribacter natronophilus]|uniref:S41 family peptidase n=1 Tax=Alteribacter natronophilus TaxID=2583810 RepID=UPI00110E2065|nr:S41 family peptidase [Alteribacter natronophilus]TMW72885.1 hypothetical protein FGB90_00805 [Alteribacter natronophilus]